MKRSKPTPAVKQAQDNIHIRQVVETDIEQLDALEKICFNSDRLSRRRFKHWVRATNRVLLIAERDTVIIGYGLVLLHQGTRLARLYSLAVSPAARGTGLGRRLLQALESETANKNRFYMRLEVATDNDSAIKLYESLGYTSFESLTDYYEDHRDALRMQKRIRYIAANIQQSNTPWYQQTTDFTCGPAALMMAMASLKSNTAFNQECELDIWREATTIFMTSGHGGCHPVGLALAAHQRGYEAQVYLNKSGPLFIDSVRNTLKKKILAVVDQQFRTKAKTQKIAVKQRDVSQADIAQWLSEGAAIIILISTYRMDGKKSPHWVTISGIDDECLYVHDPDPIDDKYSSVDCQYIPIARADFAKMSAFGSEKLRTCVVLRRAQ
ncbi:MAG: GNAT family N-acetyltransferase/peptidase C39 family protein [Spongiibacteraceae bacterium]